MRKPLRIAGAIAVVAIAAVATAGILLHWLPARSHSASATAEASSTTEPTATLEPLGATGSRITSGGVAVAPPERPPLERTPVGTFNTQAALADIRALEAFGPRLGGSDAEGAAAAFLRDRLAAMGIQARIEEFALPNGTTSRNVVARVQGSSQAVLVLGAHMDTKPPSPGANDNASGCAALLQIASVLAKNPVVPTVEFVFFGSEETNGGDPNQHHYGSRYRLSRMSAADRSAVAGMISVDMIGYGSEFASRTMGKGPKTLSDMLLAHAQSLGIGMKYLKDPGKSGWSDHEAYELAGIPVSWVEWRDDPVYHTAGDVAAHLQASRIDTAGRLVLDFVQTLSAEELAALQAR